jgi:hypothetical protein
VRVPFPRYFVLSQSMLQTTVTWQLHRFHSALSASETASSILPNPARE